MSRATRRKDIAAAILIVGVAIVYWSRPGAPGTVPADRLTSNVPVQSPVVRTDLPGLGRDLDDGARDE